MCAIIGVAVHEGIGAYGNAANPVTLTKLVVANNDVWGIMVNVTKASILMQYLRIFSGRGICGLCYGLLCLLLPAACWTILGGTLRCRPVIKLWNPHLPGHCFSAHVYWQSVAGTDIGLDFLILVLPMPAIGSLHLAPNQKFSMLLVFLLGFFVCAVSVVRLAVVTATSNGGNFVVSGVWAIILSVVEANVGIMCASLLALRPLIVKVFPRLIEETAVPRHSMRLTAIETAPAWPSDNATVTTTSRSVSSRKQLSLGSTLSTSRCLSWPPFSVSGDVGAERADEMRQPQSAETSRGKVISCTNMLQLDGGGNEPA